MMKKFIPIILGLLLSCQLSAQNDPKQMLDEIYTEAELCYLIDDYQQLVTYINQYYKIASENESELGESSDIYWAYYNKLYGNYFYRTAEIHDESFKNAEKGYKSSLNTFNNRNNVTNAIVLHEELAQLYYKVGEYYKALKHLDTVSTYYNQRLNMGVESVKPNYYKTLTQLAMCYARMGEFSTALTLIEHALNSYYKKYKDDDYYETLRKKGKILMCQAESRGSTNYKEAVNSYQQYVNEYCKSIEKRMDGMTDAQRNQYWLAMHHFLYDCFRLGNQAPEMLYDVVLFSKDYLVRKDAEPTNWKQIRKVLKKDECAIEFVQYFGRNDEKRLGCLVLKHNSKKPHFIDLFSADSLLNLPLTDSYTIGEAIENKGYSDIKDSLYNDKRLPELIWTKSLMESIGDAQKIYFAPDGMVNLLAIEYLMPDATKTCYRLSSTRTILKKRVAPKLETALFCGGMIYDETYIPIDAGNDVTAYRHLARPAYELTYLQGSLDEVVSIYKLRNNTNDVLLIGSAATDEIFLNLLKLHFDIIHISTHGYYHGRIGIGNDLKPLFYDRSLSNCGVMFAGSVSTLSDSTFDETMSDGVLSAAEFAQQDLSNTELVILSACQTGLGLMTEDGIHGIQRGLKQAGAGGMMLSLWSVGDYSCALLMHYFYEELEQQKTKDIHKAFQNARKRLMRQTVRFRDYDENGEEVYETVRLNRPRDVCPFILIDVF